MSGHPIDAFLDVWAEAGGVDGVQLRLRVYRTLQAPGGWDRRRVRTALRMHLAVDEAARQRFDLLFDTFFEDEPEEPELRVRVALEKARILDELRDRPSEQAPVEVEVEFDTVEPSKAIAPSEPVFPELPVRAEPNPWMRAVACVQHWLGTLASGMARGHRSQEGERSPDPIRAPKSAPAAPSATTAPSPPVPRSMPKQEVTPLAQPLETDVDEVLEPLYLLPPFPLSERALDRLAFSLGLHQVGALTVLDLRETVRRTALRGGLPEAVFKRRVRVEQLKVVRLGALDPVVNAVIDQLVQGLVSRGAPAWTVDRLDEAEVEDRVLAIADTSRLSRLEIASLGARSAVTVVEARDPVFWDAAVSELPFGVCSLEEQRLRQMLECPARLPRPGHGRAVDGIAALGEALPLAAACALIAPCDLGTIDELRRWLAPGLPFIRLQRILRLRGVTADPMGWTFSSELTRILVPRLAPERVRSVFGWWHDRLGRPVSGRTAQWCERERSLFSLYLSMVEAPGESRVAELRVQLEGGARARLEERLGLLRELFVREEAPSEARDVEWPNTYAPPRRFTPNNTPPAPQHSSNQPAASEQSPSLRSFEAGALRIETVWVPAGTFFMGASRTEGEEGYDPEAYENEAPRHQVTIPQGFWLGRFPVTNVQCQAFIGAKGTEKPFSFEGRLFSGPEWPVVGVSWNDAMAYCRWLSSQVEGVDVDLPTEAEWEWAARGGDGRRYPWGNEPPGNERAHFQAESTAKVGDHPLGRGPFGAEDQVGNVWEWCKSVYRDYEDRPRTDDCHLDDIRGHVHNTSDGAPRVLRGGSWRLRSPGLLRVAGRVWDLPEDLGPGVGFRLVFRSPSNGFVP